MNTHATVRRRIPIVAAVVAASLTAAASTAPVLAQIADYPTLDRIMFVEECIRNHPDRARQEMIYKCACAMDALAEDIPFAQFETLSTAAHAATIAGERGNVARGEESMNDARRFRGALAKAYKTCLITP